jgi:transposase
MKEYIGVDLGKRKAVVVKKDRYGKITGRVTLPVTQAALERYFGKQDPRSQVVVEASGNWMFLYETIEKYTPQVVLAHPLKTRAIAEARIKTDTIDATTLAELLRLDGIPKAYIPPREVRDVREFLRYRASLVSLRMGLKNKIHAVLTKNAIECGWSNVLGKRSQQWLKTLPLRSCYRQEVDGYLRLGEVLTRLIAEITVKIKELVSASPQAQLLMTMPGISYYSALLILSEIGEIRRFPSTKHLCSYAGLVPSIYSSGSKSFHGRITKQGSRWLRWICVEISVHAANGDARLQSLYRRVSRRRGFATAKIAVARKILAIIYAMLKNSEPFRGRSPRQRILAKAWSKKSREVSGHPPGVMVQAQA